MEKQEERDDSLKALRQFTGDNALVTIGLDDSFGFKCQQCGKCCMNRTDIILNPFDVYNGARYLGITPMEFLEKYCHTDLGAHSKIPMVLLSTTENGFCPLLKFDVKDGGKFKCMIHAAKPGACANHPIGVAYGTNLSTGETNTQYIKVEQCPNSVSDEQHTVREWIQPYLDHQEEINVAHKIQHLVTNYFEPRKFWLVLAFLHKISQLSANNATKDTGGLIKVLMGQYLSTSIGIGYTEYDINRPFIEQAEENIKALDDFYTHTKELFDQLASSYEKITGTSFDEEVKKFEEHCRQEGETTDGNS